MSKHWRIQNRDIFIRDLLRDYCRVRTILREQSKRFEHSGTISYAVLTELIGDNMHRGVFWSLKDSAHHLFRTPLSVQDISSSKHICGAKPQKPHNITKEVLEGESLKQDDIISNMIDWCVGYAFHECVKLKEDAFQRQHYANRLLQLRTNNEQYQKTLDGLLPFTQQTHESMAREIERIMGVLVHTGRLLILFLENHKENKHVARFLVEDRDLVQDSFEYCLEDLFGALYGNAPAKHYILALELALEHGRENQAKAIIAKAIQYNAPAAVIDELNQRLDLKTAL